MLGFNFILFLVKINFYKNRDKIILKKKLLIVCIDDSKVVVEILRKIVEFVGYNLIGI